MTESDQARWNARYQKGAYAQRSHPSAYLAAHRHLLEVSGGSALDVACGRGRNSRYLANLGFTVDAFDVSDEGLRLAASDAELEHSDVAARVRWQQRDLLAEPLLSAEPQLQAKYDVIVMVRFVALELLHDIACLMRPGGLLFVEQHLVYDGPVSVVGPGSTRFRVRPGVIAESIANQSTLSIQGHFEGLIDDPDGAKAAVARIIAQKMVE